MNQEHTWGHPLITEDTEPTDQIEVLSVTTEDVVTVEEVQTEPEAQTAHQEEGLDGDVPPEETSSAWERTKQWVGRNKVKLALGVSAVSLAATPVYNPMGEVTKDLYEASPWVAAGVVTTEALFAGGIAMMAMSVGGSLRNPFKMRGQLQEICQKANDSMLFKTGFWTNTVGAVGSAAVIGGGIIAKLPPESYGLLSFSALDIGVTVTVRKALMNGIKNKSAEKTEQNA